MTDPPVSVILPTYNRARTLPRAIDSVLTGTFEDLELVVVDGGSTDGTRGYLDSLTDPRLSVITRDSPRGLGNARNAGLAVASGEYIVFLDDDDVLYEDAIQTLVKTIRHYPSEYGGVYSARKRIDESGAVRVQRTPGGTVQNYEDASIGGPTCTLVRASVADTLGGFDESLPACEDTDFWLRLLADFDLVAVDQVLYEKRAHRGQMTNDPDRSIRGNKRLIDKHTDRRSDPVVASLHVSLAHKYAQADRLDRARSELRRAIRTAPREKTSYCLYCCLIFGTTGYELGRRGYRAYRRVRD